MNEPPKYVAEIRHVHEVALHGSADLACWTDRLQEQGLRPITENDRAQVVFTAVSAKWMGIPFRELSFGVLVRADWHIGYDQGIYLVHAFNSSRLFAFCERTFFRTPYYHSNVRIDASLPVSITAASNTQKLLEAKMRCDMEREAISSANESWEGPIYLPSELGDPSDSHRFFWARLAGQTQSYPFDGEDTAEFYPAKVHQVLGWLLETDFRAERWSRRTDAVHARSKTITFDKK